MKRSICLLLALLVCCALCALPAFAANEDNTEGIVFTASLDTPALEVSAEQRIVTLRVVINKAITLEAIGATVVWDAPLQLTGITNDDDRIDFEGSVNLSKGSLVWVGNDQLSQLKEVSSIATVTFAVPADTPAGSYTLGLRDIQLSRNYGDAVENSAVATAVLTITEPDAPVESESTPDSQPAPDSQSDSASDVAVSSTVASGDAADTDSVAQDPADSAAASGGTLPWTELAALACLAVIAIVAALVLRKKQTADK